MRVKVTFVPMEGMPPQLETEVEGLEQVLEPMSGKPLWIIVGKEATYFLPDRNVFSVAVERGA